MKRFKAALAIGAAISMGCSPELESFADRVVTDAEREFSIEYLELVASGGVDSAYAYLVSELQSAEVGHSWKRLRRSWRDFRWIRWPWSV